MAVFQPIPLPGIDNNSFSDVFDYLEKIKKRKQEQPLIEAQARHANAQAKIDEELANLPLGGHQLSGASGKALGLHVLKTILGEDHPIVKQAEQMQDLENRRNEGILAHQKSLIESQPKRFASPQAKLIQEEQEINEGVLPGTGIGGRKGVPLTSDQKKKLQGVYGLKQLKDITDAKVRERILYSKNMEKTLDNLNPEDLTQYSGLQGLAKLANDKRLDLSGKTPEKYKKYQNALTASKLLAKQVRQFYGDSITKGVQKQIQEMTNPTNWLKSPKIALANFNALKNILNTEAKTFTDAVRNADIYAESKPIENEKVVLKWNPQTQDFE